MITTVLWRITALRGTSKHADHIKDPASDEGSTSTGDG